VKILIFVNLTADRTNEEILLLLSFVCEVLNLKSDRETVCLFVILF
jgi:hypothetical protein